MPSPAPSLNLASEIERIFHTDNQIVDLGRRTLHVCLNQPTMNEPEVTARAFRQLSKLITWSGMSVKAQVINNPEKGQLVLLHLDFTGVARKN